MASTRIRLVHEDERVVRFASSLWSGLFLAVFGGTMAWLLHARAEPAASTTFALLLCLLFLVVGVAALFHRHELEIDLVGRRWKERKGFLPSPRVTRGALSDLHGVTLTQRLEQSGGEKERRRRMVWKVHLEGAPWSGPLTVGRFDQERKAQELFERLAERLVLPAVDRTGLENQVRMPGSLDRSLADRVREATAAEDEEPWAPRPGGGSFAPPPAGSRIEVAVDAGRRRIVLPAPGFSGALVFLTLLFLTFAGFGLLALASVTGLADVPTEGDPVAGWLVGVAFTLVGLGLAGFLLKAAFTRVVVSDEGSHVRIRTATGVEELAKADIEEIDVRGTVHSDRGARGAVEVGGVGVGARRNPPRGGEEDQEVRIRSDGAIVRLGQWLEPGERAWLASALTAMVAGPGSLSRRR